MKPAVKYGIIAVAWLLFFAIGSSGNNETTPSDIPPSTEVVVAQETTEPPTESTVIPTEPTETPTETAEVCYETTVPFMESEAIKNLLFSISSWDTITEDSIKSSAGSNGLEVDVDMGWGRNLMAILFFRCSIQAWFFDVVLCSSAGRKLR